MTDELERLPPDTVPEALPETAPPENGVLHTPKPDDSLPALTFDLSTEEMPVFTADITAPDNLDIDAALAALASLQELAREDAPLADDAAETEVRTDTASSDTTAEAIASALIAVQTAELSPVVEPEAAPFFSPPPLVIQRGQAASVVPAVLLMASGGWLAYLLLTGSPLPADSLPGLAACGIGLMLLAQWFSAGRWTRGTFLMGALLTFCGGVQVYVSLPGGIGIAGLPLFMPGVGGALLLTALLTPPRSRQLTLIGLAGIVAGAAAMVVTSGTVDPALLNTFAGLAPIVLIVVVIILLLPFLRRR